jgi:hypothetical protein
MSTVQAGMLLARLGRPEVTHCILGLEQYSHAYEEAGEYALDIRPTPVPLRENPISGMRMNQFTQWLSMIRTICTHESYVKSSSGLLLLEQVLNIEYSPTMAMIASKLRLVSLGLVSFRFLIIGNIATVIFTLVENVIYYFPNYGFPHLFIFSSPHSQVRSS